MSTDDSNPHLSWDLFCRVVDNFGDVGVCWRLARELAARGQLVRLWIDDPRALAWMAPGGHPGVEVLPWGGASQRHAPGGALEETPGRPKFPQPPWGAAATPPGGAPEKTPDRPKSSHPPRGAAAATPPPGGARPAQVVIEAFGCDPDPAYVAAMAAAGRPPVWINLEYLSAEDYVERSHRLASPQQDGPGRGLSKWFFYPGFTARTGGLLREHGLVEAREKFDRGAWLPARGLALAPGERLVSLFCYPSAPVPRLVDTLAGDGQPTLLATAPGAATELARSVLAATSRATVRQVELPWLTQDDYDRLLWSSDLNFVRGEDSWVRAHWAGQPFVWQAYPQDDGAHAAKVDAFLDRALSAAPTATAASLRTWFHAWNGLETGAGSRLLPPWTATVLDAATVAARAWREELLAGPELVASLLAFVQEKL